MGLFSSKDNNFLDGDSKLKKGEYVVRVICKNCKFKQKAYIPKKVSVTEHLKNISCSECDLKELKMMRNQSEESEWMGDFFDDVT